MLLSTVYKIPVKNKKASRFNIGDYVRISKYRHVLAKGYLPSWSTEIFHVRTVQRTVPHTYLLEDLNGEIILGSFYEEQLQKTNLTRDYLVEKVIRKNDGKFLVKWLGFDETHNSCVSPEEFI
jgi:hypothetical protein